jgi:outer membrane protein
MKSGIITAFFMLIFSINGLFAQKVAFVVTDVIRDNFPEARQAEQRLKSIVDDWKRELEGIEKQIADLKQDIAKNRLIWSDEEKATKQQQLADLNVTRQDFARRKFEPGGEYDQVVKAMMKPIEEKIYATVQQVAADEGYDIVLDKSVQAIPYSNPKYDLTVKVLRKLGVNVEKLEAELQEKIKKDPRNQRKKSKQAPGKRRRKSRSRRKKNPDIERQEEVQPDQEAPPTEQPPPLNPGNEVLPDSLKPKLR